MSFLSRLFFGSDSASVQLGGAVRTYALESPWATSNAHALVYSDMYGGSETIDRATAMKVAPIKRGTAILKGSIADLPLEAGSWTGDRWTPANRQPTWLNRTNTVQTPWHRMASTVDDLVFYGWSLWVLNRSDSGTILDAARVLPSRWALVDKGIGIAIDDTPVTDPSTVILFQGPDEGLLVTGADVVRGARHMERAWVGRVRNPIPMTVLQETERNGVTQEEAQAYVDTWNAHRQADGGAVGFLPATVNMHVFGEAKADLFTEGRNNVRLDVANLLNLPASLLDGSTATASLTYQTAEGEFSQLNEWLSYWLAPIEARLSQADVTPQGTVVRFNRSALSAVPADSHGPELEAA